MKRKSHNRRKGFSLAEAMIATVILSMAASGVILPFISSQAVQMEGVRRTLASKLASDKLEEIINTPFDNIISNYNGSAETTGQISDISGNLLAGLDSNYSNFSRSVECSVYQVGDISFILVTVTVNYNGSQLAVVRRLISE